MADMNNTKNVVPEGYHTVTPYLIVEGAGKLIEFLKAAFDATIVSSTTNAEGKTGHTEMRIGDSLIMLSEARGEYRAMPTMLYVYVEDADLTFQKAHHGRRHGGDAGAGPVVWRPQRRGQRHVRESVVDGNATKRAKRGARATAPVRVR